MTRFACSPTTNNLLALEFGAAPNINTGVTADTIVYNGAIASIVPTGITFNHVRINTSGTIGGPTANLAGDLDIATGTFSMGAGTLNIGGKLRTRGTGVLNMFAGAAAPTIVVTDSAIFAGAGSSGLLTGGTLRLNGPFVQGGGSPAAFQATQGHLTQFTAPGRRDVAMADAGTGGGNSRFGRMILGAPGVTASLNLVTNIQVAMFADSSTAADTLSGTGVAITADSTGGTGLFNTVFNGPTLSLTHGTATNAMNTVRFQNMDPTSTFLALNRNAGFQTTFNSVTFATTPTTGFYASINQLTAGASAVLSFPAPVTPASPGTRCQRIGATGPPILNWNGVSHAC